MAMTIKPPPASGAAASQVVTVVTPPGGGAPVITGAPLATQNQEADQLEEYNVAAWEASHPPPQPSTQQGGPFGALSGVPVVGTAFSYLNQAGDAWQNYQQGQTDAAYASTQYEPQPGAVYGGGPIPPPQLPRIANTTFTRSGDPVSGGGVNPGSLTSPPAQPASGNIAAQVAATALGPSVANTEAQPAGVFARFQTWLKGVEGELERVL